MINFRAYLFTLILVVALFINPPAFAHGEQPRLEISADRINPGGVIEVRGVDFEFEEVVALVLVGEGYEIPLGEIATDTDGIFLHAIALPADLREGLYYFRAVTDDHEIFSPALTVQGPAITSDGEGENGRRDEEEPLLGPVPTYPPGVIPGVAPGAPQEAMQTVQATVDRPVVSMSLIAAVTLVIVLGIMVLANQKRKGR